MCYPDVSTLKQHVLRFVTSGLFEDNEIVLHCVAAACDAHHSVVAAGQDSVRNLRRLDLEHRPRSVQFFFNQFPFIIIIIIIFNIFFLQEVGALIYFFWR